MTLTPHTGLCHPDLLLLCFTKNPQNVQEEVQNVQVEIDGGQDVLLWGDLVHHHVHIKDDKTTEQDGTEDG